MVTVQVRLNKKHFNKNANVVIPGGWQYRILDTELDCWNYACLDWESYEAACSYITEIAKNEGFNQIEIERV